MSGCNSVSDCLITKSKLLFEIFNQVHIFVTEHLTVLYGIMHESADMHHFVVVEPPYKYAQTRNIQLMQIILFYFLLESFVSFVFPFVQTFD